MPVAYPRSLIYTAYQNFATLGEAQAAALRVGWDLRHDTNIYWDRYIPNRDETVEAAQARQNSYYNRQYWFCIVPALDYDWMQREYDREDIDAFFEYQREDWHCALLTKDGKISFYQEPAHGEKDRRTEMRLGRYLRRFTRFDDDRISEIAAKTGAKLGDRELKFATTREDIHRCYVDGPNSCMAGQHFLGEGEFRCHPAEVYASPDLAVAYLEQDGDITARCVVNVNMKRWISLYGDTVRLKEMLKAEGYNQSPWTLHGCRLLKIYSDETKSRIILPYFDASFKIIINIEDDNDPYVRTEQRPNTISCGGSGCYEI